MKYSCRRRTSSETMHHMASKHPLWIRYRPAIAEMVKAQGVAGNLDRPEEKKENWISIPAVLETKMVTSDWSG